MVQLFPHAMSPWFSPWLVSCRKTRKTWKSDFLNFSFLTPTGEQRQECLLSLQNSFPWIGSVLKVRLQVCEKFLHVKSLKEERKHCLEFNCADRKNIFSKWRKNKSFVIKIPNDVRISGGKKAKIVAVYEKDPRFSSSKVSLRATKSATEFSPCKSF